VNIQEDIEQAITNVTGIKACIQSYRIATGGSINNSRIIELKDGRKFFIKSPPGGGNYPGMFAAEFSYAYTHTYSL
jgi:hypothetical protein